MFLGNKKIIIYHIYEITYPPFTGGLHSHNNVIVIFCPFENIRSSFSLHKATLANSFENSRLTCVEYTYTYNRYVSVIVIINAFAKN